MPEETRQLTEELHSVGEKLDQVLTRLDTMDRQAARERTTTRRHRWGSAILAVVVVAVGLLGYRDSQERQRAEHRACIQANETRADIRAAIVETVLVIIEQTDDPAQLTPVVERIQDRLTETIPDREC